MSRNDLSAIQASNQTHIVPFRTTGAGLPLFCFPGAGGNVYIFQELVAALPEGQPVYVVDMESLGNSDEAFSIEQLAPVYLKIIRAIQRSGPYYFCGYSFGGLIAYEIALKLLDEGDGANLVSLLDASNPAMLLNLSQIDAAQFRKDYVADRFKKYADSLQRGDIKAFAKRGSAFIVARLGKLFTPALKKIYRLFNAPLPDTLRYNDPVFQKAWQAYVPGRYAKSLVVFRVEDRGPEYDHDPSMGWDACVTGGVQVHTVPGGHVDMMKRPSVQIIAEKLATYLDPGAARI
jgi:thioesterase domain-containing protein